MNMHASTHTNKHVHKHAAETNAGERQDYLAIETNNKNPNPEMSLFLGVFDGKWPRNSYYHLKDVKVLCGSTLGFLREMESFIKRSVTVLSANFVGKY